MRLNDNNSFIGINPPYQLSVIHSSKLIYPREIYQRGVERKRVELIARDFNEYIVNEPKVSFRNGRYYVMDGQHTIEGCILRNGGEDRPILCKVYTGLTMEQEALLFAEQNGHAAPLSAGIKLRAKVVGGDAPSKAFVAATNRYERQQEEATVQQLLDWHRELTDALQYAVDSNWLKANPVKTVDPCLDNSLVLFDDFPMDWLKMMKSRVAITTYANYEIVITRRR